MSAESSVRFVGGLCIAVVMLSASLTAAGAAPTLIDAVKSRDSAAVSALLKRNTDVNVAQPDGATALHWAAHWDDLGTADLLIRAGARVNAANDYGVTPLMLAATNGSAAMIERLLTAGAQPDLALPSGETALMTAARAGSVDAVKRLLARGANVNAREIASGQTALMWAAAEGHAEVARLLIESGAPVAMPSAAGFTPFLFAAREGALEVTRVLLAAGANVNERAADKSSALLLAIVRGHTTLAEFLLDQGADPDADGPGYSPLHWVAGTWETTLKFRNHAEPNEWAPLLGLKGQQKLNMMKALLAHGANPNARVVKNPPLFGMTASGVNPRLMDLGGATPFLVAAKAADTAAMRILLAAGANPLLGTNDNTTALIQAAGVSRMPGESIVTEDLALEAVQLTLQMGLDVNARNEYGDTALHAAAFQGFNSVVQLLVDRGARLNVKNADGDSPLRITSGTAARRGGQIISNPHTLALLRKLGADEVLPDRRPPGREILAQPIN